MISQRVNALEAKKEELHDKIKTLQEEWDRVEREQAKNWEDYDKSKDQEEKIYSEMPLQKRNLFKMIRRTYILENEQEEGRRKGDL